MCAFRYLYHSLIIYFPDFRQHARSDYTLSAFNGLEDIRAKINIRRIRIPGNVG